ncbi:MAG: hypothetical protein QOD83_4270 [Solirubrobacteraceae bacterium]|jgi:hypothetical protein|nr:hypothetical protein [Solirubrobacteraceae bacterium]
MRVAAQQLIDVDAVALELAAGVVCDAASGRGGVRDVFCERELVEVGSWSGGAPA